MNWGYNEEQSLAARPLCFILKQMIEAAVDCLDDPILLVQGNTQSVEGFTSPAVWANQRLSVLSGERGMTSVFLAAFGANACVADLFFHVILPPC